MELQKLDDGMLFSQSFRKNVDAGVPLMFHDSNLDLNRRSLGADMLRRIFKICCDRKLFCILFIVAHTILTNNQFAKTSHRTRH